MALHQLSQSELGQLVGVKQSTMSSWVNGVAAPSPDTVFALEAAIKVPPGSLSRHLGYVPLDAAKTALTVKAAVHADTALGTVERAMILAAHAAAAIRARRH